MKPLRIRPLGISDPENMKWKFEYFLTFISKFRIDIRMKSVAQIGKTNGKTMY
jgi:hypothetical protein